MTELRAWRVVSTVCFNTLSHVSIKDMKRGSGTREEEEGRRFY
jgi:hypothetical protein